ncbi:putative electron transfer flavoprotein-ubiquinone oxidoreductase, mitochondrial [Rhodotorula toruloides]|nr:putative electron transfer flavoprotein-ubiquinone oxidoreductase, mitochondrial [Rhodotorula toruloides]
MLRSTGHAARSLGSPAPALTRRTAASLPARLPTSSIPLATRSGPSALANRNASRFALPSGLRAFSTTPRARQAEPVDQELDFEGVERVQDEVDVCIVGGGPAGLSAAIQLMKLAQEKGEEIRVVVLEKGAEVGAHILSGAVIEPRALDELIPDWKEKGAPLNQEALSDSMRWLTPTGSFAMPHPPQMSNKGNYIISLSKLTRWLGEQAEELGVEIYPGFAGAKILYTEDGTGVRGVQTNDIGLDKNFKPKDSFEPGMEFLAKVTILAEGCHGSLSKQVQGKFNLREGKDPQTYGLGVKEVWKVKPEKHEPGKVQHTLGWPLDNSTYGGTWLYHMEDEMVSLGIVVGLDYKNPYISPYKELQRLKHHPLFADLLEGGECIAYGARALNEGGYQSIPKLTFPGGAMIGDSAGFLNVPKIKGTHTSMKSGMLAAEAAFNAITSSRATESDASSETALDVSEYEKLFEESWVAKELKEVRNLRPSFHTSLGNFGGIIYSGIDSLLLKGRVPWTFHHPEEDYAATLPARQFKEIDYPKPDGKLSFDILESVSRTNTYHAEDQPVHLHIEPSARAAHVKTNVKQYAGLLGRVCPAAVYEYVDAEGKEEEAEGKRLVINSQNCIHCKTCSIKVPTQDIQWRLLAQASSSSQQLAGTRTSLASLYTPTSRPRTIRSPAQHSTFPLRARPSVSLVPAREGRWDRTNFFGKREEERVGSFERRGRVRDAVGVIEEEGDKTSRGFSASSLAVLATGEGTSKYEGGRCSAACTGRENETAPPSQRLGAVKTGAKLSAAFKMMIAGARRCSIANCSSRASLAPFLFASFASSPSLSLGRLLLLRLSSSKEQRVALTGPFASSLPRRPSRTMASSCAVVTGPPTVTSLVSTTTVLATQVSTAPDSTLTTSTAVVTSNCLLPTVLGQLALCQTTTSFAPLETVVPGSVLQVTSTGQSLVTVVQTLPGATSTVCEAVQTTPPPSSSSPSSTTTTTTPRRTTTTPPPVLVPSPSATTSSVPSSSSAVAPSTPTSDSTSSPDPSSSSPSPIDVISPSSSDTPTPTTPPSTATEIVDGPRRSTSYITSYVTVVDSSGQTLTSASTIPTLLNIPGSNTSRASPGAIAGGTVGGIAALALAAFFLWMMRKRGYFRRGDEQIEEDAWDPAGHGDYFAGGGRGGSRRSAAGMAGVGAGGGRSSPGNSSDEKHDPLSEKDREIDAATLERHKSWYHRSIASHGDDLDLEEAYGGEMTQPAAFGYLPTTNESVGRRASTYVAPSAAPPRRSMSTAMSVASRSSHSHESYPSRHPSLDADRRMSHPTRRPSLDGDRRVSLALPMQYPSFQSFVPPPEGYIDEPASYASRSPPLPQAPVPAIARPKSASPPIVQHSPYPTVSRQRSLPGLQGHLPIHMRSASLGGRPTLSAIQAGRPSTHSRTVTSDSMSTVSTPQSHYMPALTSSASESTLVSTIPSTPSTSLAHDKSSFLATPPLPVLPNIERLKVEHPKRPSMDRNVSSDSIFHPSQWLGARVVNADDSRSTTTTADTDTETIASNVLAGESSDSLAAAEMISRAQVRIDGAR